MVSAFHIRIHLLSKTLIAPFAPSTTATQPSTPDFPAPYFLDLQIYLSSTLSPINSKQLTTGTDHNISLSALFT